MGFQVVVILAVVGVALSANPERSRSPSPIRGNCNNEVGFSAVGAANVPQVGLIPFRQTLFKAGVDFSQNTGEVSILCPGVYFVSFSINGDKGNTRVQLKKKTSGTNWSPVVASGGTTSFGGSNGILLNLSSGDQLSLWLMSGNVRTNYDNEIPTTTFTVFKLSSK